MFGSTTFSQTYFSGAPAVLAGGLNSFVYSGTGGLVLGGTATMQFGHVPPVAGGLTLGGTATVQHGFRFVATGGLTLGGTATVAHGFRYLPSGGLALGGAATVSHGFRYLPTGGLLLGGTASATYVPSGPQSFVYAGTGGLGLGGAADASFVSSVPPVVERPAYWSSPRTHSPIEQITPQIFTCVATGGLVLGGAAQVTFTRAPFIAAPLPRPNFIEAITITRLEPDAPYRDSYAEEEEALSLATLL